MIPFDPNAVPEHARQTATGAWASWPDHDAAEERLKRKLATWPMRCETAVGLILFRTGNVNVAQTVTEYLLAIDKPPHLWPLNPDLVGALALLGCDVEDGDYLNRLRADAEREWPKRQRSRDLAQRERDKQRRIEELKRK